MISLCEPLRILLWLAALKGSPFLCLFLENWKYLAGGPVAEFVAACAVTVLWCSIIVAFTYCRVCEMNKKSELLDSQQGETSNEESILHFRIVDTLYMKSFRCSGIPEFLREGECFAPHLIFACQK